MSITSQSQDNVALVTRFFEGIDAQDPEIFDEVLADDFTTDIYRSGDSETVDAVDAMQNLWAEYWTAFPDLSVESMELIADDDSVAVFRTETGTHEGEFRGIAPTNADITFEYSGYVTVEDGEITFAHFRGDMLNLLGQLGIESPLAN